MLILLLILMALAIGLAVAWPHLAMFAPPLAEGDKPRDESTFSDAAQANAQAQAGSESSAEPQPPVVTPGTNPGETTDNAAADSAAADNTAADEPGTDDTAAGITLTNHCEETVSVALLYQVEEDRWIRRGWWGVDSGATLPTHAPMVGGHFFFYAWSKSHQNIGLEAPDAAEKRAVPSLYKDFEMDDDDDVKGDFVDLLFSLQNGTELTLSCDATPP